MVVLRFVCGLYFLMFSDLCGGLVSSIFIVFFSVLILVCVVCCFLVCLLDGFDVGSLLFVLFCFSCCL